LATEKACTIAEPDTIRQGHSKSLKTTHFHKETTRSC